MTDAPRDLFAEFTKRPYWEAHVADVVVDGRHYQRATAPAEYQCCGRCREHATFEAHEGEWVSACCGWGPVPVDPPTWA